MKKLFIVLAALLLLCSCGSRPADHGEDFAPCTICGRITGIDDLTDVGYNDEYLCKDCLDKRTFLCEYCGSRFMVSPLGVEPDFFHFVGAAQLNPTSRAAFVGETPFFSHQII
jgi:uncharacterized protein YlaI